MDFRDHAVKKALNESVGPYRPERSLRSRALRIAMIAVLAITATVAFVTIANRATTKPAPHGADRRPIPIVILPAQANR